MVKGIAKRRTRAPSLFRRLVGINAPPRKEGSPLTLALQIGFAWGNSP